jgi:hypothetical protein
VLIVSWRDKSFPRIIEKILQLTMAALKAIPVYKSSVLSKMEETLIFVCQEERYADRPWEVHSW